MHSFCRRIYFWLIALLIVFQLINHNHLSAQLYFYGPIYGTSNSVNSHVRPGPLDIFQSSSMVLESEVSWALEFGFHRPFQQKYLDIHSLAAVIKRRSTSLGLGLCSSGDEWAREQLFMLNLSLDKPFYNVGIGLKKYRFTVKNAEPAQVSILQSSAHFQAHSLLKTYIVGSIELNSKNLFDERLKNQLVNIVSGLSFQPTEKINGKIELMSSSQRSMDVSTHLSIRPVVYPMWIHFGFGALRRQSFFGLTIQKHKMTIKMKFSIHPYLPVSQSYTIMVEDL